MHYRLKHDDIHIYISRIFKVLAKKLVSTVIILSVMRTSIIVFLIHFRPLYLLFHSSQWNMKLVSIDFVKRT